MACFITFWVPLRRHDRNQRSERRRFSGDMEPREEDNNMVLLVVSLVSVTLVGILEFGSTKPAVAEKPSVLASEEPVRVILPFKPNTTPGER
jgi:hypothetical protein